MNPTHNDGNYVDTYQNELPFYTIFFSFYFEIKKASIFDHILNKI